MDAGQGARAQAARAARQVEEARRRLEAAEQRQRAWEAGAEGEHRTAEVLAELTAHGWLVLHDLHWPGRPFANIDHIAIGPGGIAVIDSKNWTGRVDVRDGTLRQNGYRRVRECEATSGAGTAVAAWLEPRHRLLVRSIICLVQHDTGPTTATGGCVVVGLNQLRDTLDSMQVALSQDEVWAVATFLRGLLGGARSPSAVTTAALDRPAAVRNASKGARRRAAVPSGARRRAAAPNVRPGQHLLFGAIKIAIILIVAIFVVPGMLKSVANSLTHELPRTPAPAVSVTTTPPATP